MNGLTCLQIKTLEALAHVQPADSDTIVKEVESRRRHDIRRIGPTINSLWIRGLIQHEDQPPSGTPLPAPTGEKLEKRPVLAVDQLPETVKEVEASAGAFQGTKWSLTPAGREVVDAWENTKGVARTTEGVGNHPYAGEFHRAFEFLKLVCLENDLDFHLILNARGADPENGLAGHNMDDRERVVAMLRDAADSLEDADLKVVE